MTVNIFKDRLQHAKLFGKPVLTTSGIIPRETVPDGWYCYDMQATGRSSDSRTALVDYAAFGHRGTVLSPAPLKRPSTAVRRIDREDHHLHRGKMDLKDFCEKHRLDYPDNPIKFEIRPAFPSEAGFFMLCHLMRTRGWGLSATSVSTSGAVGTGSGTHGGPEIPRS